MPTPDNAHSASNDTSPTPWRQIGHDQPSITPVAPDTLKVQPQLSQPQPGIQTPEIADPATQPPPSATTAVPSTLSPNNETVFIAGVQEVIIKTEHLLLGTLSLVLIFHGLLSIYDETIQIFYVFPQLPQLYKFLNYSEDLYTSVYRRSVIISGTALLETLYGTLLISRFEKLAHRLHIFTALSLLFLSYYLLRGLPPIDTDKYEGFPEPPSIINLIRAHDNQERIELFKNINKRPTFESESNDTNEAVIEYVEPVSAD